MYLRIATGHITLRSYHTMASVLTVPCSQGLTFHCVHLFLLLYLNIEHDGQEPSASDIHFIFTEWQNA